MLICDSGIGAFASPQLSIHRVINDNKWTTLVREKTVQMYTKAAAINL